MAKNTTATKRITISTTPQVSRILEWLATRGTFGKNAADVAERIVSERLREFLPDEKFTDPGDNK
jgi:hypothetical protein